MSKETLTSTFTELRKGFLRLAMRFLPSQEDADDALQEAFFRLWKQADRISSREEAEALTVVTVKNLCIDILRRKSHLQTVELDENRDNAVGDPESEAQEREELPGSGGSDEPLQAQIPGARSCPYVLRPQHPPGN